MNKKTNILTYLIAILMLSLGLPANAMEKSWLGQQLIWTTRNDDLIKVKDLLKSGAPVNEKDENEMTALMWAARCGYQSSCEALLQFGAFVNEKNNHGETALNMAADFGYHSCCELLLNSGALVNEKDDRDETALIKAARWDRQSCCEILLKYGASINEKNIHGLTALTLAAKLHRHSCCELLVEIMLGLHPFYTEEVSAALFCLKEIQEKYVHIGSFDDLKEPIILRLCFAQKMHKDAVLAEVNRITNNEIKQALIKKYFTKEV